MSGQIVSIALWIPFGIVFLISALIFCRAGYKRGLWRSLISLGATVVSALVSLLLAGLLAKPVTGTVVAALEQWLTSGELEAFRPLLAGAVKSLLALLFFSVLLLIIVIITKILTDKYLKKYCMTDRKGMRWGGLGVRLVDALLYTQLLLLPLYGTIAAFFPTVNTVLTAVAQLQQEEAPQQVLELVDTAAKHPLTRLSAVSPAALVYRGLSTVRTEHGSLDIAAAAQSVSGTVERIRALEADVKNETVEPEKLRELLHYLRSDVVEQEWFYTACMELVNVIARDGASSGTDELIRFAELADMTREDFVVNADALLEFGEFAMQEQVLSRLMDDTEDPYAVMKETGLLAKAGETINATAQAVSVRQLLVQMYLQEADLEETELYGAILNAWGGEPTDDPDAQLGQATALMELLTGGSKKLDMLTYSMYLENFDREAARQYIMTAPLRELFPSQFVSMLSIGGIMSGGSFAVDDVEILDEFYIPDVGLSGSEDESGSVIYSWGIIQDGGASVIVPGDGDNADPENQFEEINYEGWALLTEYLGGEEALRKKLWDTMVNAVDTDSHMEITDTFDAWMCLSGLGNREVPVQCRCSITADTMKWAAGELGPEYFDWLRSNGKLTAASAVCAILEQTCKLMETGEIDRIWRFDCSIWDLAMAVELCATDAGEDELREVLSCCGGDIAGCQVAQALVRTHGSDPLGMGGFISAEEKATIIDCAAHLEDRSVPSDDILPVAERAAALLAFFGAE